MFDVILVLNELLDYAKRFKKKCILVNADFKKAYDNVSQNLLRFIMKMMGFGNTWMV